VLPVALVLMTQVSRIIYFIRHYLQSSDTKTTALPMPTTFSYVLVLAAAHGALIRPFPCEMDRSDIMHHQKCNINNLTRLSNETRNYSALKDINERSYQDLQGIPNAPFKFKYGLHNNFPQLDPSTQQGGPTTLNLGRPTGWTQPRTTTLCLTIRATAC
jgi:hypothetical protein